MRETIKRGIPDTFISLIFPNFLKTHNLSDCYLGNKSAYLTDVVVRVRPVYDISVYDRNDVIKGNGMIYNLISSIIGSDNHREVVHASLVLYQNPCFEFAKVECRSILDDLDACEFGKPAEELNASL